MGLIRLYIAIYAAKKKIKPIKAPFTSLKKTNAIKLGKTTKGSSKRVEKEFAIVELYPNILRLLILLSYLPRPRNLKKNPVKKHIL